MIQAKTIEGSVTDVKYWLDFECDVIQDFPHKCWKTAERYLHLFKFFFSRGHSNKI